MQLRTVQFQGLTSAAKISIVCYQIFYPASPAKVLRPLTAHLPTSFLNPTIMADEVYEGAIGIDLGKRIYVLDGQGRI